MEVFYFFHFLCNSTIFFLTVTQKILLLESPQISRQHTVMLRLVLLSQEERWMEMSTDTVHIQTKRTSAGGGWTWV